MILQSVMNVVAIMSLIVCAVNPSNIDNVQFVRFPMMDPKKRVMFLEGGLKELAQIVESVIDCDIVSNTNNSKLGFREGFVFKVAKEELVLVCIRSNAQRGIRVGVDTERGVVGLSITQKSTMELRSSKGF